MDDQGIRDVMEILFMVQDFMEKTKDETFMRLTRLDMRLENLEKKFSDSKAAAETPAALAERIFESHKVTTIFSYFVSIVETK